MAPTKIRSDVETWYWYVAKDDELMMDLDGQTLLEIAIKRIERDQLPVFSQFVAPSQTENHFHFVVRLRGPMDILERMVWQLYLMDHCYRSVKNLFRAINGVPAPSLLISPGQWKYCKRCQGTGRCGTVGQDHRPCFWRKHDATCNCPREVHKDPAKIKLCPAHILLRGEQI